MQPRKYLSTIILHVALISTGIVLPDASCVVADNMVDCMTERVEDNRADDHVLLHLAVEEKW